MREELFKERKNIRENAKKYEFLIKQLETARGALSDKTESLSYSDFKTYYETGSRKEYEAGYFEHRRQLSAYAVLAAVYPEDETYRKGLENIIWAISDEFSWALPAHIPNGSQLTEAVEYIDLFAAETAFALSEILCIAGNKLDKIVRERAEYEIRRRVISPYLSGKKNKWDDITNNWAAVCAGSVGAAFLYLAEDDEIERALPRLLDTLSCYLDGFGNDGACTEGINYWIYGFGYFTYFARLLYQYTDGKIDLFDNPKVKEISEFPQKIRFSNCRTVTFSDCGGKFISRYGLSSFLNSKFSGAAEADEKSSLGFEGDGCYRFAHIIRDFAWYSPVSKDKITKDEGTYYFKDASWYIKKNGLYEFAAKAGDNDESHNHNDIGSFILNVGGECIIADPGKGEYTAEYFGNGRYSYFAPSSRAHSVPFINGTEQAAGKDHRGEIVKADDNRLVILYEKAYDDGSLISLKREFEFENRSVVIRDTAVFGADGDMTERIITECEPELTEGCVKIGSVRAVYDGSMYKCTAEKHTFSNGYDSEKTVYSVDFHPIMSEAKSRAEIKFEL